MHDPRAGTADAPVSPGHEPAEPWSPSDILLGLPFLVLGGLLVTYGLVVSDPFLGLGPNLLSLLLGLLLVVLGCAACWRNRYPVLRRLRLLGRLPVGEGDALQVLARIEADDVDSARWRRESFHEGRRGYHVRYQARTGAGRDLRILIDGWTGAVTVQS